MAASAAQKDREVGDAHARLRRAPYACGRSAQFIGFLFWQAKNASKSRHFAADVTAIRRGANPATASDASGRNWDQFVAIVDAPWQVSQSDKITTRPKTVYAEYLDGETLRTGMTAAKYAAISRFSAVIFEESRPYPLEVLRVCSEEGSTGKLSGLLHIDGVARPLKFDGGAPAYLQIDYSINTRLYFLSRFNAARMVVSMQDRDLDEYLAAAEQSLCAHASWISRASSSIALTAWNFRRSVVSCMQRDMADYPDTSWHDAALALLRTHDARSPLTTAPETSRAASLDYVHFFFSDPEQVGRAMCGLPRAMTTSFGSSDPAHPPKSRSARTSPTCERWTRCSTTGWLNPESPTTSRARPRRALRPFDRRCHNHVDAANGQAGRRRELRIPLGHPRHCHRQVPPHPQPPPDQGRTLIARPPARVPHRPRHC